MLPVIKNRSESCQTSRSLWGLSQVPIFDASANTNSELAAAVAQELPDTLESVQPPSTKHHSCKCL